MGRRKGNTEHNLSLPITISRTNFICIWLSGLKFSLILWSSKRKMGKEGWRCSDLICCFGYFYGCLWRKSWGLRWLWCPETSWQVCWRNLRAFPLPEINNNNHSEQTLLASFHDRYLPRTCSQVRFQGGAKTDIVDRQTNWHMRHNLDHFFPLKNTRPA